MTADEMIDNYQKRVGDGFTRFGVRELMKAYARQKCSEQRENCYQTYDTYISTELSETAIEGIGERIRNAPEPEIRSKS